MCLRKTQPKHCSWLILLWEIWNFYHLPSLCLNISGWFFVHVTRIFLKRKKNGRNLGTQGIVILNECYIKYLFCCYLESNALKLWWLYLGGRGTKWSVHWTHNPVVLPPNAALTSPAAFVYRPSQDQLLGHAYEKPTDCLLLIVVFNLIIDVFFTLYFPNYLSGVLVNFNSGQKKF